MAIEVGQRFTFVTSKGEERGPYEIEHFQISATRESSEYNPGAVVVLRNETTGKHAQVFERWLMEPRTRGRAYWSSAPVTREDFLPDGEPAEKDEPF